MNVKVSINGWLYSHVTHSFHAEGNIDTKLEDVLIFVTGAGSIPPTGFPVRPCVSFLHHKQKLSTASTCDQALRLPIYEDYVAFKEAMILSILGNDGLGGGV